MASVDRHRALEGLDAVYGVLDEVVAGLAPEELLAPSGCAGWKVPDLLFHLLLDAQRALVALHSPVPGPADTDFVDYWRGFSADDDGARMHAQFVRAVTAAHSDLTRLVARWRETAAAARRAATATDAAFVTTQGHRLALPDFVTTLVVEAVVHHLDLVANLEGKPLPAPAATSLAVETVDGLLGVPGLPSWDAETYLRKATGRTPLTDEERAALGAAAARIPVFS